MFDHISGGGGARTQSSARSGVRVVVLGRQGGNLTVVDINGPKVCTPTFGPIAVDSARSAFVFDSLDTPSEREWVGQGEELRYSDANAKINLLSVADVTHVIVRRIWG
jgi:hypothetical protein